MSRLKHDQQYDVWHLHVRLWTLTCFNVFGLQLSTIFETAKHKSIHNAWGRWPPRTWDWTAVSSCWRRSETLTSEKHAGKSILLALKRIGGSTGGEAEGRRGQSPKLLNAKFWQVLLSSPYNTPTPYMPLTEIIASAFQFKWTSSHLKVGVF